jgi:hypothetical protein
MLLAGHDSGSQGCDCGSNHTPVTLARDNIAYAAPQMIFDSGNGRITNGLRERKTLRVAPFEPGLAHASMRHPKGLSYVTA